MGDVSLLLREDGYIRMNFQVVSLIYHSNLNIILVQTYKRVHVLDVNSGVILQSYYIIGDTERAGYFGVEYASGADRVFVWDDHAIGARTDYNGVLLLHTALQRPLPSSNSDKPIGIELVLSEAVLLYQCLQSLDPHSIEGLSDVIKELKNAIEDQPVRRGVKTQKWSTVLFHLPQSTLRLVTAGVVQELKGQNRRIPALAIASAVGQRANELTPYSRDEESRVLMYSEAERKETFKRWPHMDYKWALPARMAQAGFYHQPSPSGDDRAMCFTCLVCLVCWEKSDEPWVEHERHSPNCPFVRGEYTHNVPISVTNATACAVPSPNVTVVSRGNTGDLIATGTEEGKVNIWKFDCGLKLVKVIQVSPYDSIFSGILALDTNKVWSTSLEKDTSTYELQLTAMAFVSLTSQKEAHSQAQNAEGIEKEIHTRKTKPSLVCGVVITRTNSAQTDAPIKEEDTSKALFDSGIPGQTNEMIKAMNDQNEAKNNVSSTNRMLFLLTYDIQDCLGGSVPTVVHTSNNSGNSKPGGSKKVCAVPRTDDASIYDEIYFQYSDEDTELPQCTNNIIDEQLSNVFNLNASSSKDDSKMWEPKKIIFTKHFATTTPPPLSALLPELPPAGQASALDFVGKISQLKSWKSGNIGSIGTKLADQTDAILQQADHITQYLNMTGQAEIADQYDLKWYEGGDGTEKVKDSTFTASKGGTQTAVGNSNNDGFDSDPPQNDEIVTQSVAFQCLIIPKLDYTEDCKVTHLYPTEDKEHLLVVLSRLNLDVIKRVKQTNPDAMDEDCVTTNQADKSDCKAYFILYKLNTKTLYTLEDNPVSIKELSYHESPVDLCLLPADKHNQYSVAVAGIDGALRLYSLPDFNVLSEKRVPKGHFTSVAYCTSVERLSACTKQGTIYFYALNSGDTDTVGDIDDDELANLDFNMLQRGPRDEVCGHTTGSVIIANKSELDLCDLESLMSLAGSQGTNNTVPYSAVVPGFWCEVSPAQRPRSDHQNNRTWRLQNTSSTWDEHVLELTLPFTASLAHIEFGFTLHKGYCENLPIIQVTLLKQNLHGIGYKRDHPIRSDSPVYNTDGENSAAMENPVNSEEYLQAHNAEILAGPLLLSSGLDLSGQSGTLILTSPRLYRARGRTFLIHIKTLFDPANDMAKGSIKGESASAKRSTFIGCDWLQQISLTVRSSPHTDVPMERQQRIAMLESNSFLNTLCEIVVNKGDSEMRNMALDILNWVISIRLQRIRLSKTDKGKDKDSQNPVEAQQTECIKIVESHCDALIKTCLLCANRSIAKKCIKILMITSEGVVQMPKPWKLSFEKTLRECICNCIPYMAACDSPGALRWLVALAQHTCTRDSAGELVSRCLVLLGKMARALRDRSNVFHHLLRARFGLYGLPLERSIFTVEVPELGKSSSTPVSYASVLAGDTATPPVAKVEYQLKDLLNLSYDSEGKAGLSGGAWWCQNMSVQVVGAGLSEAMPLHVVCHATSEGTKLESVANRHHHPVVSSLPADAHQLWTYVKEGQTKQDSQDPDTFVDVETPMECDPQDKVEFTEEKFFKEQEQCSIPWAQLLTRPPQHTLVVERNHSGARRYIILDFGHSVLLSDVVIPSCSDLATLSIDTWLTSEDKDSVKLAFATDIATKHLVLTDIQPPPLCRYIKITGIGRYGMSAMKCKIPLGWFFGEIAEISNVSASINVLESLRQDLTCRFRLATGKLMDLLNPYLKLFNGNAAHMMAYLNLTTNTDTKVMTSYNECIELQQQLHTCNVILKKIQCNTDCNEPVLDMINKGQVTSVMLLERASTDKLRVMCESIVDMLLYICCKRNIDVRFEELSQQWCSNVSPLVWEWGGRAAAAMATLLPRLCGAAPWWGTHLADTLTDAFQAVDGPPLALDRCLVVTMYMCRKSMLMHSGVDGACGVAQALATRVLTLVRSPQPHPALAAALLTALAALLDAAPPAYASSARNTRWDWVTGGRPGSASDSSISRSAECKLQRRKLNKKLYQMQEIEATRTVKDATPFVACARGRGLSVLRAQRMALAEEIRTAAESEATGSAGSARAVPSPRLLPPHLAARLAQALVTYMLGMDSNTSEDMMLLAAKVVGRLCALSGGAELLEPACILGLARLAVTLPSWPRHAITTLLQELVEHELGEASSPPAAGASDTVIGSLGGNMDDLGYGKAPRRVKTSELTPQGFILTKNVVNKHKLMNMPGVFLNTKALKNLEMDYQLTQVAESDDSESEDKLEQYFMDMVRRAARPKSVEDISPSLSNISTCVDARLESGPAVASEAGARRLLLAGSGALAAAVRAPPKPPAPPSFPPPASPPPSVKHHPPLAHTLYDVFRHLALEFHYQMECTMMENVVSLWLTLNGSAWGSGGPWLLASLAVPADTPRIRLACDTVTALLKSLATLENVSLRCWVLSLQALAWIASLPLQTEGSNQTMGRMILDCEHFVPAIVKFITSNVATDGAVTTSEPYLGGSSIGGGAGAASALQSLLSRVVCARGAAGALASLRVVAGVWRRVHDAPSAPLALDLHSTLLRVAHPLLHVLSGRHTQHAIALIDTVAHLSSSWVRECGNARGECASDARLSGLLADVLAGSGSGAGVSASAGASSGGSRRAPLRRTVLVQLMHYCRQLLTIPLPAFTNASLSPSMLSASGSSDAGLSSAAGSSSGGASSGAGGSSSGQEAQTDESKAQAQPETTNIEDERKQYAAKTPRIADAIIQQQLIMQKLYKTLTMCDGLNMVLLNSVMNSEPTTEYTSLKEEIFWLVARMGTIASNPTLMVHSLMEFLRKEEIVHLSLGLQQLLLRLFDMPEPLAAFIDGNGLELSMEKLAACHQSGPSGSHGLVSALMNYLKQPPQIVNMSTSASGNKKNQPPVIETTNGLINMAPFCTVTCGNPTAQAADILLGGCSGSAGAVGPGNACGARRVRAAAWSYHFFSADDVSLALTLRLPYSAQLHEIQLQPHCTSLATCPGAVAVEAGCGGTLAPLGPPQNTAGMTFIRLVVTRPIVCNTVQIRLYKPRDSFNMGLLQLRLLAAPAFSAHPMSHSVNNNWAAVVSWCLRTRLPQSRWICVTGAGAVSALAATVAGGGPAAGHAHHALLATARTRPEMRAPLLATLLAMDVQAHAHAFEGGLKPPRGNGSLNAICALVRQLCRCCAAGTVPAYVQWLVGRAEAWLRDRTAPKATPAAALVHTFAAVLWTLKEENVIENLEELITDDLFELVYTWVKEVPEKSLLKNSLDAVLCSMCYIRPELFIMLLEHMDIPFDRDDSMEGLTDDRKVHGAGSLGAGGAGGAGSAAAAWRARGWQLRTVAAAAMSPAATLALLHSHLPTAVVTAIADYSEAKLQMMKQQMEARGDVEMFDFNMQSTSQQRTSISCELPSMKSMCDLVDWTVQLCQERKLKDWLGGDGSVFWKPLLTLLCYPRIPENTWQEMSLHAQLEESTIRLFAELTVCHSANQKLFASTLHNILETLHSTETSLGGGISGFSRALILRLVLSSERGTVALRWASGAAWCSGAPSHPAAHDHALYTLPLHTTVRALLLDHRPPLPLMEETTKAPLSSVWSPAGASVPRSASDTAITVAEAWELSLAAGSASKDKRVKDVKNTTLKQHGSKKKTKSANDTSVMSGTDDLIETTIRVQVPGIEGYIPPSTTLGQLIAAAPHVFGPHLTLTLHLNSDRATLTSPCVPAVLETSGGEDAALGSFGAILREFGACGGLALVASRLPRPNAAPPPPLPHQHHVHHDLDWVKLDDPYEEAVEVGAANGASSGEEGGGSVPAHALVALGLLLKLQGYAQALLDEGPRAVHLLRLLLGVTHDEDGRSIVVGGAWSLGTLPFRVVSRLLEAAPTGSPEGKQLRLALLQLGAVRLVLTCLAVFTHHKPTSNDNSQASNGSSGGKTEDKSQLYWAKGTGFGTGSTQQSWNVEQALVRQRTEEEHVTVLLQVLASYMNPGEKWPPEEGSQEECTTEQSKDDQEAHDLPPEFIELLANSSLVPAISSYLRNDSVLDMSRHIPLYVCVLRCARALHAMRCTRLAPSLRTIPRLLYTMSRTTNSYATKLRMSKKNIFGKMMFSQRFSTPVSSNSEFSEEDEGLASLIADIQATSALMCTGEEETDASGGGMQRALQLASGGVGREARYIELMRTMQFETFEMLAECSETGVGSAVAGGGSGGGGGFRFAVPYHFEGTVRAAGERTHPARMKRLAQEAATLATSLPLSYSSSVFVRTDTDRLDVMKVLITGPSDTPYANGCFVLDVYFPVEYPSVPMLINLETTGRHSVRFNPNLYNDGKVCLSVLNTWHGRPEEKWNAHTSSFLQVLVSIQSLILVPEPYFNEPGYERSRGTRAGNAASLEYNSNIYQACVRWAMLDHLRNPTPCFKQVIQTHFWIKRNEIMRTVAGWIDELQCHSADERTQRSIHLNLMALKRHYVKLQEELAKLPVPPGLEDLDEPFQYPTAPSSPPPQHPAPTNDEIDHDMEKIVSQVLD